MLSQPAGSTSVVAAKLSEIDKRLFVASSIADAKVDQLRLLLALQDNPADAARSSSRLKRKVTKYEADFNALATTGPTDDYRNSLRKSIDRMKWWNRNVFQRRERRKKEKDIGELDRLTDVKSWEGESGAPTDPASNYSLVFWRECDGKGKLRARVPFRAHRAARTTPFRFLVTERRWHSFKAGVN